MVNGSSYTSQCRNLCHSLLICAVSQATLLFFFNLSFPSCGISWSIGFGLWYIVVVLESETYGWKFNAETKPWITNIKQKFNIQNDEFRTPAVKEAHTYMCYSISVINFRLIGLNYAFTKLLLNNWFKIKWH